MSDNAAAVLLALVIFASGTFSAWFESPSRRTGRCQVCGAHGHPTRIRDPRHDDQAGT